MRTLNNNKGSALIIAYMALSSVVTLSAGFALSTISELNNARRYQNSTAAFWAAEAGINQFLQDTTYLNTTNPQTITIGSNTVVLSKDDSDSSLRVVTATSTVNGSTRQLQVEFPSVPPDILDNTVSSGGNMTLGGLIARMDVYGQTRLSGTFSKSAGTVAYFDDKIEGVASGSTTFTYPDSDANGTANQFNDFVEFNRDLLATYPSDEVVYIQSNSTVTIVPNTSYVGKKIVYVEGTSAGAGDVNLVFSASWAADQNLTVISTGDVNYIQPLTIAADSKLNTIAWNKYYEPSFLLSAHKGVNYSHGTAEYFEILDYSNSTGAVIANGNIVANEALAWKKFYHDDDLSTDAVPPGFEGLVTSGTAGYSSTPSAWKEI